MKLILFLILFVFPVICNGQQPSRNDLHFKRLILGTWREGSAKTTYFINNNYIIYFKNGSSDSGSWSIKNGKLTVTPTPVGFEREYNILQLNSIILKYQLTNKVVDDAVYVAKRIVRTKPSKANR